MEHKGVPVCVHKKCLGFGGGVMRKGGPRKKRKAEEEIERDSVGGKCACFNFGSVVRLIDGRRMEVFLSLFLS